MDQQECGGSFQPLFHANDLQNRVMNITSFLQDRQYGFTIRKSRRFQNRELGKILDDKTTKEFVNKACSVSGTCRSTFIMEFSPDGTKVASAHGDHTVRITDIASGQCVRTLQGHPRTPWCLAYHPSSSHILASGCLGGQVRIWDLYGYGCEVWQSENSNVIASLTFHPTDHVLVIGAGNSLYFWDWSKPEPFTKCSTSHEYEKIRWVRFDRLGHNLYTGIANNTVLQREEVPSVSSTNPSRRQPSRLSNMYSRIINYYQEYRRERLANETSTRSAGDTDQARQTGSDNQDEDPYPGVRDIEIVEPRSPTNTSQAPAWSTIEQANSASQVISQLAQTSRRNVPSNESRPGRFNTTEVLINPNNDPFLPVVPHTSAAETRSVTSGLGSVSSHSLQADQTLSSDSGRSSQAALTERLRQRDSVQVNHDNVVIPNRSDITRTIDHVANLVQEDNNSRIDTDNGASVSGSSLSGSVSSQDTSTSTNSLSATVQALTESIRSSITSCSDINPYLAKYLKTQAARKTTQTSTSTSTQPTKTFPSIRDRLKINIPLSTQSGANLTSTQRQTGIPPVTVLPGSSNTQLPPVTVLSTSSQSGIPQVKVLPSNTGAGIPQVTGIPLATVLPGVSQTGIPPVTILPSNTPKPNTVLSNTATHIPQVSVVYSHSSGANLSKPESCDTRSNDIPTSTILSTNLSTINNGISNNSVINQNNSERINNNTTNTSSEMHNILSENKVQKSANSACLTTQASTSASSITVTNQIHETDLGSHVGITGSIPSTQATVSASSETGSSHHNFPRVPSFEQPVTSQSNLFENVQRARAQRRLKNSEDGYQPYRLPTPHAGLSLMGPYLASRGFTGTGSQCNPGLPNRDPQGAGNLQDGTRNRQTEVETGTRQVHPNVSVTFSNHSAIMLNNRINTVSESINSTRCYFLPISDNSHFSIASQSTSLTTSSRRTTLSESSIYTQRTDQDSNNQPIELVVDQNENYTAVRNANTVQPTQSQNEVQVGNNDSNNNSLHIVHQPSTDSTVTTSSSNSQPDRDYIALRNTFVSMTDQIEREMSDLNRRINALRDSFNQSLFSLRQDRQRIESVGQGSEAAISDVSGLGGHTTPGDQPISANPTSRRVPVIVTDITESQSDENESEDLDTQGFMIQPPTLLETSLRSHRRRRRLEQRRQRRGIIDHRRGLEESEPQDWRQLQRHCLHPHYSSSIFDETINRPSNAIQSAINRAIAGAFMGTGESAVANNIINQTHRIQCWDFSKYAIPDITKSDENIVVLHCKLHNSASCDISPDGSLLATFVPSHFGFPDDNIMAVYSLLPDNLGQCLYTKSFGPNAISISISPSNNQILVGLAAKKLTWVFTARQMVAQIYELVTPEAGEKSTKLIKDIFHPCSAENRSQVSGNSARWLPLLGQGLVYGTNRGHLNFCKPGMQKPVISMQGYDIGTEVQTVWGVQFPVRSGPSSTQTDRQQVSTSTQTPGTSHTAATQTETDQSNADS